jgi:hypothetical protein
LTVAQSLGYLDSKEPMRSWWLQTRLANYPTA